MIVLITDVQCKETASGFGKYVCNTY